MSKTARTRKPDQILPALLGAGRFVMGDTSANRPLRQPTWLLELFVAGTLEVNIADTGWRTFQRSTGVLYAPDTRYRERRPREGSASVCLFFTPGSDATLAPLTQLDPPFRLIDDPDRLLTRLVQRIIDDLPRPGPSGLWAQGCFYQAISLLLSAAEPKLTWRINEPSDAEDDLVSTSRQFMQTNLHRPIQIADLAQQTNLSPSGFAHAYRRDAGRAPMQDLRRIRVEAVKVHLLRHRMTLAQIAELTGFSDAFHLSHAFRQVTGVSPRQYRQQASDMKPPNE